MRAARIMQRWIIGVSLILAAAVPPVAAQSLLQGTVAGVDPANGRFLLAIDGGGTVTIEAAGRLSAQIVPGTKVRVFGRVAGNGRFEADRIEPVADPTGVRSRLLRRPPSRRPSASHRRPPRP